MFIRELGVLVKRHYSVIITVFGLAVGDLPHISAVLVLEPVLQVAFVIGLSLPHCPLKFIFRGVLSRRLECIVFPPLC